MKRKIKKIIYKCNNVRKDEQFRRDTNQSIFCNSTIEYIKSGYFIKPFHSSSCLESDHKKLNEKAKQNVSRDLDKEHFIQLYNEIMNNSTIYDWRVFKEEFKNICFKHKYNFQMNDNMLSNLMNNWRRTSDRFTKLCIFNNKFDY